MPRGFTLERVETRAEGTCADCAAYQRGLRKGVTTIAATAPCRIRCRRAWRAAMARAARAARCWPRAPGASLRLAFEDHGDAEELRARAAGRRGSQSRSRARSSSAATRSRATCTADASEIRCPLDWDGLAARDREALAATRAIPYGEHRSYAALGSERPRLRGRPDDGRQPDPDRRALPPRDPRDRAPAGLRRRHRAPALARRARAPATPLEARPRARAEAQPGGAAPPGRRG